MKLKLQPLTRTRLREQKDTLEEVREAVQADKNGHGSVITV